MKLFNYSRATLFVLAAALFGLVRQVWRFGWWCVGKAIRPGLTWR